MTALTLSKTQADLKSAHRQLLIKEYRMIDLDEEHFKRFSSSDGLKALNIIRHRKAEIAKEIF